jgi:hypothetical protein
MTRCVVFPNCFGTKPFGTFRGELGVWLTDLINTEVRAQTACLYDEIRELAPAAGTFILGYPRLVSGHECEAGRALPGFGLSAAEQAFIRFKADQLNGVLKESAANAGVHFVEVDDIFEGHEVCGSSEPWIFGVRLKARHEAFHPNTLGHREGYAAALNEKLKALVEGNTPLWESGVPKNPEPMGPVNCDAGQARGLEPTLPLLGDLDVVAAELFSPCSGDAVFTPGQSVRLRGDGLAPNAAVTLRLERQEGEPVVLGDATASAQGSLDTVVTIPGSVTEPIAVMLSALGARPDGGELLLQGVAVLMATFDDDVDSDNHPDLCDVCPTTLDREQIDTDGDGIGDACDACPNDPDDDADGDGLCSD